MKIIKIIRESIKKNPNAGNRKSFVQGNRQATFISEKSIPESLKNKVVVTGWNDDGKTEGIIINPDDMDLFLQIHGISIKVDNDVQIINHPPEPRYFFEYENPLIKCEHCHQETLLSDYIEEYNDDGDMFTVCPKCNSFDSCEDFEYESINDVINDIKQSL